MRGKPVPRVTETGIDEPLPGEGDAETDGGVTSDRQQTTGRRHLPGQQVVANAGEQRSEQA